MLVSLDCKSHLVMVKLRQRGIWTVDEAKWLRMMNQMPKGNPKLHLTVTLNPRIRKSFAGVRGRVKAAVAAQPRSVTWSEALEQIQKFQKAHGTSR